MVKSLLIASAFALSLSPAFAFSTNPNAQDAPGQVKARANCFETIAKQNANGQTGSNTGSANDSKQLDTAVTNCDKFWSNVP